MRPRRFSVQGVSRSVEEAIPRLQGGDIGGIIVVPTDFHRDVLRGSPTGVTVMGHGGYIVVDGTVLETTAAVVAATAAPAFAAQLVRSHVPPAAVVRAAHSGPAFIKQPLFNTVQGYGSYVVPAAMGLIIHQMLIIAICILIGTWVEAGRWPIATEGWLSFAAFAGMLGAFWLMVFAAVLFWIGFVFWYHDLPRAANLPGAIVFSALYAVAVAGVGIAVGCWIGERERALQIIGGVSIPLLFLSGFAFPVESISQPLVWLSHLLPTTPGIQGFIKLNQMGATWRETWSQFSNLLLLAVLYIGVAWWAASETRTGTTFACRDTRLSGSRAALAMRAGARALLQRGARPCANPARCTLVRSREITPIIEWLHPAANRRPESPRARRRRRYR